MNTKIILSFVVLAMAGFAFTPPKKCRGMKRSAEERGPSPLVCAAEGAWGVASADECVPSAPEGNSPGAHPKVVQRVAAAETPICTIVYADDDTFAYVQAWSDQGRAVLCRAFVDMADAICVVEGVSAAEAVCEAMSLAKIKQQALLAWLITVRVAFAPGGQSSVSLFDLVETLHRIISSLTLVATPGFSHLQATTPVLFNPVLVQVLDWLMLHNPQKAVELMRNFYEKILVRYYPSCAGLDEFAQCAWRNITSVMKMLHENQVFKAP